MSRPRPISYAALALALALAAGLTLCLGAPAAAGVPGLDATRVTLGNGLTVVLAPDSSAGTVDASLWYRCGTRHESAAQAGLASLAARLTFRNGASGDPIAPLAAEGGTGLLAVTPDYTSFSTTVPAEGLGTALAFLAARMPGTATGAPTQSVGPAALATERAAVDAERKRSERTPVARGLARLWAAAWPGHPYARTGAAPTSGSATLAVADVEAWRKSRYGAANAVLTLTGAFDRERALADVRAAFQGKVKGTALSPTAVAPKPVQRSSERIDVPARLCLVGWRGPGAGDPDAPALELLATCLGGGSASRLSASLVQDWKVAAAAQAGFTAQREGSLLWTLAVVPLDADTAAVERTLFDATKNMSQNAPEAFELERARRQLEAAVWFGLQTARQRGQALGEAELMAGDAAVAVRRLTALDKVTSADLQRVAARVMTDAGRAVVWILPTSASPPR